MFWIFLLATSFMFVFVKLGMYSVWVSVLSAALKLACVAIAGFLIAHVWRRRPQGR